MGTQNPEIDRYLITLPSSHRKALRALRAIVHQTVPGVSETMDYRMPTFRAGDHVICSLASQKHHITLYICGEAVLDPFREDLAGLDCGHACVRFRPDEEFSQDLAKRIIARAMEMADGRKLTTTTS